MAGKREMTRRERSCALEQSRTPRKRQVTATASGSADGAKEVSAPPRKRRSSTPLGADIARELERLIIEGTLAPGERLNEVALAARLGVSRGPVREAARALEKTGLVTVIMNRGAFVRQLSLDEAMAIYEINAVLFGRAAAQAAGALNADRALSLSALVDDMDRAIEADDRDGYFSRNVRFHAEIMAGARNREAETLYHAYTRKLLLLRRRSFEREGNMRQSNEEHRGVLEAILAGDAALARSRAEAHGRLGRARFLAAIGQPRQAPPAAPAGDAADGATRGRDRP
jgi:DNA-binding GntR family transcriptional regulator